MKNSRGITLVALIITVVIMLILAGVAIGSVTGDGLFSKTRDAVGAYENASRTESEQIQTLMNEIDNYLTGGNVGGDTEGVEPETVAKIGDFVNYSVKVDSNGNGTIDEGETYDKWRILDFDNIGHMEIVCYNGPSFTMGGKDDYANAIQKLNNASEPYKNGTYGESTRHLGSDPSNPSNYGIIDSSYIKFYDDYDNTESNANYRYIVQKHHESDLNVIKSFSNTAEGKRFAVTSWLASRFVYAVSSYSGFNVCCVYSSGSFGSYNVCSVYSDGSEGKVFLYFALAPVVSLESGVKINTSLAGNGSEDSPWVFTK